eukprot:30599-Pelagococcus_subviridis.AAC.1
MKSNLAPPVPLNHRGVVFEIHHEPLPLLQRRVRRGVQVVRVVEEQVALRAQLDLDIRVRAVRALHADFHSHRLERAHLLRGLESVHAAKFEGHLALVEDARAVRARRVRVLELREVHGRLQRRREGFVVQPGEGVRGEGRADATSDAVAAADGAWDATRAGRAQVVIGSHDCRRSAKRELARALESDARRVGIVRLLLPELVTWIRGIRRLRCAWLPRRVVVSEGTREVSTPAPRARRERRRHGAGGAAARVVGGGA